MKQLLPICFAVCAMTTGIASAQEGSPTAETKHVYEPIWPFVLGAAAVTWLYCEHGPDDCRTNTKRLWGTAAVVSVGIAVWAWSTDRRSTRLGITVSPQGAPTFVLRHEFDG